MADFDAGPYCKSCPAQVIWAETERGKAQLVDAQPVQGGNIRLTAREGRPPLSQVVPADRAFGRTDLRLAHFVTCPQAAAHRRKGRQHS